MTALKAVTLASITPSARNAPRKDQARIASYWREVTKALDEVGSIWSIAANQEVPQAEGETARSIKHQISGRNTPGATLKLMAGNASRPEVAIRATLYGRKGFGPTRAKILRFKVGNRTVYARKVRGTAQNDWLARSLTKIEPAIDDVETRLAALSTDTIQPGDIAGAHRYHTAPPAPSDSMLRRRKRKKK